MNVNPTPKTIQRKLAALRRGVRGWLLISGGAMLSAGLTGLVFFSLLVDRFAKLDVPQRAVMLCLMAGCLGYLLIRRVIRPLLHTLTDDGLCLQVEARHPEARNALITALQLSRGHALEQARGFSSSMEAAAVEAGEGIAASLEFGDVLDRRRRAKRLLAGAGALLVLVAAFFLFTPTMQLWFQRNVLLQSVSWPRDTTLRVANAVNGVISIPEGADLALRVDADPDGVIPHVVEVQSRPLDGGSTTTRTMSRLGQTQFQAKFENVVDPFKFRVDGNDHRTEWFEVQLLERPELLGLRLTARPPAYVGVEEQELPPGQSAYRVLHGSGLEIRGRSQKRLKLVRLTHGEKRVEELSPGRGEEFTVELPGSALQDGRYSLQLTDTRGISMKQPATFVVRIQPDRIPDVRCALNGIGSIVLPGAVLPIEMRIKDDYGIESVQLQGDVITGEDEARKETIPVPGMTALLETGETDLQHEARIELTPMGVAAGMQLLLQIEAADTDTVSGPKTSESATISLRVVTPEELREELLRREQDLHQQFTRIVRDQKELYETCRILNARVNDSGMFDAESKSSVEQLERGQQKMIQRTADVAAQFRAMLAEIRNNRLEPRGGPTETRLVREIIRPVDNLTEDWLPRAVSQFRQIRVLDEVETISENLGAAEQTQADILERMQQIEASMAKAETIQEAILKLRSILKLQRELREKTEEERTQAEESIFD